MTDKEIPTVPASHRLRALAKDVMQDAIQRHPRTSTSDDDDDAFSERLDMAAQQLAAVVEHSDPSLLIALAESYIEHLMREERRNE
jgi:hypothetical protein